LGVVLLVAVSAWCQQSASANSPATKEEIQRLFVAMRLRERTEVFMNESQKQSRIFITDFLLKQVPEASKRPEQVRAMIDDMLNEIYGEYPIDAILQDMVPIYQKYLSNSDVDALISFYSTPVGQKMLRELPHILAESSQITQSRLQPRLQAGATKLTEELTKMIEEEDQPKSK
jgi:hypothetical protein